MMFCPSNNFITEMHLDGLLRASGTLKIEYVEIVFLVCQLQSLLNNTDTRLNGQQSLGNIQLSMVNVFPSSSHKDWRLSECNLLQDRLLAIGFQVNESTTLHIFKHSFLELHTVLLTIMNSHVFR